MIFMLFQVSIFCAGGLTAGVTCAGVGLGGKMPKVGKILSLLPRHAAACYPGTPPFL